MSSTTPLMAELTSAQIRGNPDEYEPFVVYPDLGEKMGVKKFCEAVVEVSGWEAGEWRKLFLDCTHHLQRLWITERVHVTAISGALNINVKIATSTGATNLSSSIKQLMNTRRLSLIYW